MKSKLNKQQKKYIKSCDGKELRKVFTKFFKNQNKILKEAKKTPIVFKDGSFTTNNPFLSEFLDNHPMFSTKTHISNYLTKEDLESLTNPDLIEKKKDFENAIDEHLSKPYTILTVQDNIDWLELENFKEEIQIIVGAEISHLTFTANPENENFVFYKDISFPFEYSNKISDMTFSDKERIANRILNSATELGIKLKKTGEFIKSKPIKYSNKENDKTTIEFDLPKTSQKIDELLNAIKLTYSREDMFKCFYESRLTNPIVGFKFDSFASYIEYLQK